MKTILKLLFLPILWFASYTSIMNGFVYHKYDDLIGGIALGVLLLYIVYRMVVPKKKVE